MKIDVNHVNSRKKDVEVKLEDTWRQYNEDLQPADKKEESDEKSSNVKIKSTISGHVDKAQGVLKRVVEIMREYTK
nr:MAG TPA: hypothetical protein [Caudoviricetes sp.]